ncbi:hypothetical protein L218DRAFT_1007867 [Marasmius fiardii PR-910]|nr:hypothetical protein L218DRAFT_1007867 [Marasmius fiardii PR-910]
MEVNVSSSWLSILIWIPEVDSSTSSRRSLCAISIRKSQTSKVPQLTAKTSSNFNTLIYVLEEVKCASCGWGFLTARDDDFVISWKPVGLISGRRPSGTAERLRRRSVNQVAVDIMRDGRRPWST